jgi:O-antigen/teichoic acid export membrane protein
MSEIQVLFKHSSHYAMSQVLSVMAGFISFPILTRVLSINDYGILSLIISSVMIILPVTKLGLNHSSIRFFEEFKAKNKITSISYFYNTLFWGSFISTTVIIIIFLLILNSIPNNVFDSQLSKYVFIGFILIFLRSLHKILMTFLRAEQKSLRFCFVMLGQRYGMLLLGLISLFFILKNLYGYFIGVIIADLLILVILLFDFIRKTNINWKFISIDFFKMSIMYGLPIIGFEAIAQLLTFSDRYLIQHFLGLGSLGIYSACNNIIRYVALIISVPLNLAILPICMKIWTNKGKEQTKEFLSKSLRYFCFLAFPITLGVIATGKDLVVILASQKYLESHVIIPYIIIGKMLFASCHIISVPMYLYKKTSSLTILFFLSFIAYLILNFILIQHFELLGAAYTTLITYALLFLLVSYFSFKYIHLNIHYLNIGMYFLFSLIMYLFIMDLNYFESTFLNLSSKVITGTAIYLSLILSFDKSIRSIFKKFISSFQVKVFEFLFK